MKSFSDRALLAALCTAALTFSAVSCSCPSTNHGEQSRTRGIGVYPGAPSENFSPSLENGDGDYRNLALHRAAYASSSHDYNLTAQLLTDGILTHEAPCHLILSSGGKEFPVREREWMLDEGPASRNRFHGGKTSFQLDFNRYSLKAGSVHLKGSVYLSKKKKAGRHSLKAEISADGKNWETVGRYVGNGLENRKFDITIDFGEEKEFSHFRLSADMDGATDWLFNSTDFLDAEGRIQEAKPSGHFCSAWMSAGSGEEWIDIDLGAPSRFDQARLHWIGRGSSGKILVSADRKNWKEAGTFDACSDPEQILDVRGKGRHVRIALDASAEGERHQLTEIEVFGKGGTRTVPAASPAPDGNEIILSGGNWKIQRSSETAADGEAISGADYDDKDWLDATVPGTVLTSWVNAGAVPDPNFADNQRQISESFFWSDFWYRDEFDLPEGFAKEKVFLNFDGINWKAEVYLNGQYTGRIDGAFIRGCMDVTDLVNEGHNTLAVKIIRNSHIGAVKEKNKENPDFNGGILGADNPTFHASIGWDWIPTIRGRNIGIWNDVRLTTTGPVTVSDPLIRTVLPLPDTTSAAVTAEVMVRNHSAGAAEGLLEGRIGDVRISRRVRLEPGEERAEVFSPEEFSELNIRHPRLWWPRGYGKPELYDASFTFTTEGGISDRTEFKAGLRQMEYDEDNGILSLYINGRRFIGRGGNWGFGESNLNYRGREYDIAVAYHADMNMTMIRNWVGMIGDEEFYEACDRHGIMVWQDFWLANPLDGPDPYYPDLFIANAGDYVKRIRSHASIALYCGRNEGFPPENIDKALRRIVKESHPDMHYISSSADGVVSGHGPYRMLPAKEYFTLEAGNDKFHSERGMPNIMTYESMLRTFSEEGIWPQDNEWGMHDFTRTGAQGCTSFNNIIREGYGEPENAEEFAGLAQWVNYDGHRSLFESRSRNRKGLLMWMSHSCWPSMVWQTYDYYFEPTAAYFAIKKACEPLHIQWNPATDRIEAVNWSAGSRKGLEARAEILDMYGKTLWSASARIDSEEDSTVECFKLEFPENVTKVHFIRLQLKENGKTVSDNFYHRSLVENDYRDLRQLPAAELTERHSMQHSRDGIWKAEYVIRNQSDVPALMVRLNLVDRKDGLQVLPVIYSDNYFALLPGEEKTVTVQWKEEDTRSGKVRVKISSAS